MSSENSHSSQAALPTVILKPGEANRILAGHPWIYAGSILRLIQPAADGDIVQIKDHRNRFLGVGLFNSRSKIRVRWLSTHRESVDTAFFKRRLQAALEVRQRQLPGATSFRLVNAESDFLSGLVVDKYEDCLVMQITSLGMEKRKPMIIDALRSLLSPKSILERSESAARKFEGLTEAHGCVWGEPVNRLEATLGGLHHEIPWGEGHKTGLYLDQQVNQVAVGQLARGRDVLDAFTFAGGFALQAAHQGARSVLALDQSADAVEAARRNAARNGLGDAVQFEVCNVFDWLRKRTGGGERFAKPEVERPEAEEGGANSGELKREVRDFAEYDLIILDPPSFTRSRNAVEDALRGYKEIHLRALKLLRPGGILATFCCSHHVPGPLFEDVILDAAFDAHRILRRTAVWQASPDHPVLPGIPETEYLKGFAYEVAVPA